MQVIRVTIERSGGFTGIAATTVLDAASLPAADRVRLESLVQAAGFFGPPLPGPLGEPGPDHFQYDITVDTNGGTRRTLQAGEPGLPEELRQLIGLVREKAASRDGTSGAG